ncbi:MAG: transporter [Rhodobacteraceae bacterium]|nr:transporter [Paracoccaceae bacterium]
MIKKFYKIVAVVMIVACPLIPQLANAESLRQVMVKAYNNSGLLEQNRALLRVADEDVAVAASFLRGVLGWSASIERNKVQALNSSSVRQETDTASTEASVGLNASITLYDGGQNRFAVAAAKEAVLSTRQKLVSVEQMVLFTTVQAFMEVRRERKYVALRKNNVRVIQEELKAAKDRFEVGEVTKTDVALAEARLAASVSSLASAKGSLAQAEEVYKQTIGDPAGSLSEPGKLPQLPSSSLATKKASVQNHPDIISIQHDIKQAEFNMKRAGGAFKPSVKLSTLLGYTEQEADDFQRSGSISLSASGPIYSGGRTPALLRKARAQRDAQRSGLHLTRLKLEQEAGSAFALLQMAKAGRKASEEQISASRVAFEGVREEAKVGARTTLDVLNAEQELLDAQAGLISAEADEFIAAYRVLVQVGKLTVDHLNLPVQRYDPLEYYNFVESAPTSMSNRGKKLDQILKAISK